jgi:hypothetical protein
MLTTLAVAWTLLVAGDFLSTFLYHVPEHVFGSLHLQTHHAGRKNFRHYAVLRADLWVLLDGFWGALPYLLAAVLLWSASPWGVLLGLSLGQLHVWWRHTSALAWQTPPAIRRLCAWLNITTPEQHWQHHLRVTTGYGDIFTFLDAPARIWLRLLRRSRPWVRRWLAQLG